MFGLKRKQTKGGFKYQYSTLIVTPMARRLLLRWFSPAVVSCGGAGALAHALVQTGEGRGLTPAD